MHKVNNYEDNYNSFAPDLPLPILAPMAAPSSGGAAVRPLPKLFSPERVNLGSTVNNPVRSEFTDAQEWVKYHRQRLFKLRRDIGEHYHRVKPCGAWRTSKDAFVPVAKGEKGNIFYSGLQTCKSVWACPVCSVKINKHRADEVRELLTNAIVKDGKKGLFVTLTLPHTKSDKLSGLQKAVSKAFSDLTASNAYKGTYRRLGGSYQLVNGKRKKVGGENVLVAPGLKQKFGIVGFVRALEVKYGGNGWHPHLHVCFLLDDCSKDQLLNLGASLTRLWCLVMEQTSDYSPDFNAQDYRPIYDAAGIADYTVKWDIAKEMVEAQKKTRGNSYTPFELFERYQETGETFFLNHFLAFCISFKGVRQLTFSRGLKALYLPIPEKTDEEICQDDKIDQVLLLLHPTVYDALRESRLEASFLNCCEFELSNVPKLLKNLFGAEHLAISRCRQTGVSIYQFK